MHGSKGLFLGCGVLLCFIAAPQAFAQGPDVTVGDLPNTNAYGTNAGTNIYAYSVATTSCNIGNANLSWIAGNNQHPVIAQDMWRLSDNRLVHVGSSWLKHGFCALQIGGLCPGCGGGGGCLSFLTPGCADPYSASLNGAQSNLGPRSQVNAFTGVFPFPYAAPPIPPGESTIGRRLQAHIDDLTTALHPGALYFVSGQYVAQDDSASDNQANNASYRRVNVSQTGNRSLSFVGATQQQSPPIQAWQDHQPTVTLVDVQVPNEGLFIVGYDVIDNGNGTWSYEYAVYNMYSDRSANSFFVPVPPGATVSDIGFRDITWHSGEPYSGVDWTVTETPGLGVTWAGEDHSANVNANAIRWSMMFNFWFTCDAPPAAADATLGLFKPGTPTEMIVPIDAPSGNFLPAPQNLICTPQVTGASTSVALNWTNGTSYDSITIRRDGLVIGTLAGGMTTFTDANPGFGPHTYTVQALQAGTPSAEIPCDVELLPASVMAVSCVQPDPNFGAVEVTWMNGMAYDQVRVYLDGALEATLAGTATSYSDVGLTIGLHTYEIAGVSGGVEAAPVDCTVDVLPPPPLGFTFHASDATGTYDLGTGIGSVDVSITADESAANLGFPNAVQGFSVGLGYDDAVLTAAAIAEGAGLSSPDFFVFELLSDAVSLGVIIDTFGMVTLDLSTETELAVVTFETNEANMAGNGAGAVTPIDFQNGVGTGAPVDNVVVVSGGSSAASLDGGSVTLTPVAGGAFRRGDANNDSTVNIADPVTILDYLFNGGVATCLDACEANDDGQLNIADSVWVLNFLFLGGAEPLAPFPGCGADPTPDAIECDDYSGGCS